MNKRTKITILSIILLAILLCVLGLSINGSNKENNGLLTNIYDKTIYEINNKETFNILITSDEELTKMFEYYKKNYSLKYKQIKKNENNTSYKKLIDKLSIDLDAREDNIFVTIKNGVATGSLIGIFSEHDLKEFLLKNDFINQTYKDVDNLIEYDFKDYFYNTNDYYTILITSANKKPNEYRSVLVKNKIKSVVINAGAGNLKEVKEISNITGSDEQTYYDAPIVINVKNKRVVNYYKKVKLNELVKKIYNY